MDWFIGILAVGLVALGAGYDRKRQRERARVSRPEINRWEEEGGAVALTIIEVTITTSVTPASCLAKGALSP
jgi:hypothetical protein